MPDRQPPPRPKQSSQPRLEPALDQQPERRVVHHPGVDGVAQAPLKRTATMPNMAALKAPPLFSEPEAPKPPNPLQHKTVRAPSPPPLVAASRRTPVPPRDESASDESASAGQLAALLAERNALLAEKAELERQARVAAESRAPGPYQKPIERSQSPVPSSAPSKTDAVIGKVVRTGATKLAERYGLMPLLVAVGLGGGVVAVAKPTAEPGKVTALEARVGTLEQQAMASAALQSKAIQREALRDAYFQCLLEEVSEAMAQLLPAQDRVGNAAPMKPWVERCSRLKP